MKNFLEIALSRSISEITLFAFYAEIQDGHQKWGEKDFWKKSPVDSSDTLRVKKFHRNHSISLRFQITPNVKQIHFTELNKIGAHHITGKKVQNKNYNLS